MVPVLYLPQHELESGIFNEVALRNHYQSPCDYVQSIENIDKSLIYNHSACAMAAVDTSADTVWFI